MRVALVSTMRTAVPPPESGSVELVVATLAEALGQRGHDVTVFAPGNSDVNARVLSIMSAGYHDDDTNVWDWELAEFMQLGLAFEHASEFDVINSHVYCYALPFTRLVQTPTIHTFHICPTPDFVRFCALYPEGRYMLISSFQRQFLDDIPVAGVVHNGVRTSSFGWNAVRGTYLAYLGDFHPNKGPLEAIRIARDAGMPIRLAGRESQYLNEVVLPQCKTSEIEYVGEVDHAGKVELLSGALGTVFLSTQPEACPMVLLESMACGTPVLALNRGPVPELVEQGITGIYADELPELVHAAPRLAELDRSNVRRLAVERFDVARMVDGYLRVFDSVA